MSEGLTEGVSENDGVDVDREAPGVRPVVAIVGRPNVGKSTLVNRVLGRRAAVVEDVPGVTRDRVSYDADWAGREFVVVDTGGWEPDARGLAAQIAAQAEIAIDAADVVVLVVDGTVGATVTDEAVIKTLRRSTKPVLLAVNKVDDARAESDASELWSLGLGQPYPISALHGRGSGELLDAILAALPQRTAVVEQDGPRRVALIGRPNVGKSSLLNRLSGEQRSVVDDVAGTTRDPVDSLVEVDGQTWRFVDTAGIRRKGAQASGAEYYSLLRTQTALESAEVAIVLLDASQPLAEQDQRVVGIAVESGRALVLAINKWDLLDEERQHYLERELEVDFGQVKWAPRVNISALTGRSVDKLARAMRTSLASWDRRIPTGALNSWLGDIVAATPPPPRSGKAPKVLFATQAATRPPRFVIFTNGFLEAGYRRFLERKLREEFGFEGSPIEISVKVKSREDSRKKR